MNLRIISVIFIISYAVNTYASNDTAMQDFRSLNHSMISQFQDTRSEYKSRFLAKHPVIVALFNSNGGQFIRNNQNIFIAFTEYLIVKYIKEFTYFDAINFHCFFMTFYLL